MKTKLKLDESLNDMVINDYILSLAVTLINIAFEKCLIMGVYEICDKAEIQVEKFITFSLEYQICPGDKMIRGPCALGYDFYRQSHIDDNQKQFLFGTPYQHRNSAS